MKYYFKIHKNRNKLSRKVFVFIISINYFLILTQVISSTLVEGSTIDVSKSELGNYTTIQDGIDAAKTRALQYADQAKAAIKNLPASPAKEQVIMFVDYVINRSK